MHATLLDKPGNQIMFCFLPSYIKYVITVEKYFQADTLNFLLFHEHPINNDKG
jgi:hypothetical protein